MSKVAFKKAQEKREFMLKAMSSLGLTKEQAGELWDFDHDNASSVEADAIEALVAAPKTEAQKRAASPIAKVKNMKAVKKADAEKELVLASVFSFVERSDFATKPQQMTSTKVSFQGPDGGWYSVAITKHKACPDGYKQE